MIYDVEVGVATSYPPAEHEFVFVRIEAQSSTEATLVASQMATAGKGKRMPVSAQIVSWASP